MRKILEAYYRFMDSIFDPLPEEFRKYGKKAGAVLYYESQDEDYQRFKQLQYLKMILNALLSFTAGLFAGRLLRLVDECAALLGQLH